MPSRAHRVTIKEFAHDYFQRVNYVDIYGRNVGYDYNHILTEIKKTFPSARTSTKWLRQMAYQLTGTVRMPMRRRARRALAEGYAMVLLLKTNKAGSGSQLKSIAVTVRVKFNEQQLSLSDLRRLERWLKLQKFSVPPRS